MTQAHPSGKAILGELPEAVLAGSTTIGVLRLAVAFAPAALRMTPGERREPHKKLNSYKRRGERGQTIILVAISIVALLAMAALAIDVVTLYVASSEIKRAADAAALAGAKGIADSGVTTLCAGTNAPCTAQDPDFPSAQTSAQNMACEAINAVLPANTVAGAQLPPLACSASVPSIDWSRQGNPIITVSLQQTNLPTFFARIWGRAGSTVSASATAEVYNPSNNSSYTPIAPTVVKPWLVANADPWQSSGPNTVGFVGPGNAVEQGGAVGENFNLTSLCQPPPASGCTIWGPPNPPPWWGIRAGNYHYVYYAPALVTANAGNNVCPSSCLGSTNFEQSIECADVTTQYTCGGGGATYDSSVNPSGPAGLSASGAECLTHASAQGLNQGQDSLNYTTGFGSPPEIIAGSGPYATQLVSTSSSIVTIPIVDTTGFPNSPTVVGFMQAFINQVELVPLSHHHNGDINVTVLNIVGCNGTSNGNTPVVGGRGTSPVAVRLIAPPTS